jgi:Tannase and feruloyl esterase.
MAALSTDTGHSSVATDSLWALNNTEKQADWGWRAMHGAVTLGKRIVTAYYATLIRHSYYSGCSTGGRQGLKELQISPDTFDGALIGAPAWWVNHLNLYILRVGLYNLPPSDPKHLSHGDIALVAGEVLRQCDGVDGVIDNIISAPELCKLDYDRLLCRTESKKPDCLTADQLRTVKDIHADWINPETKSLLHPGFSLSSEPQWPWVLPPNNIPSPYGTGYQSHFLLNTITWSLSPTSPTPEALITLAESLDPGNATVSLTALTSSLRTFARRGGKLLLWHGLADGLIPAKSTHLLYNLTSSMLGSDLVHSFMRLFLIPGLQHCWNTPEESNAPWAIGGAYQAVMMGTSEWSVPGFEGDKRFDALEGLIKWVEEGELVDSVVATTWDRPMDPKSGVKRQRPICAWPRKAVWDGVGKVDEWQSWKCIREA